MPISFDRNRFIRSPGARKVMKSAAGVVTNSQSRGEFWIKILNGLDVLKIKKDDFGAPPWSQIEMRQINDLFLQMQPAFREVGVLSLCRTRYNQPRNALQMLIASEPAGSSASINLLHRKSPPPLTGENHIPDNTSGFAEVSRRRGTHRSARPVEDISDFLLRTTFDPRFHGVELMEGQRRVLNGKFWSRVCHRGRVLPADHHHIDRITDSVLRVWPDEIEQKIRPAPVSCSAKGRS